MMRAAARLYGMGDEGYDLRVPVAVALLDLYGDSMSEEWLAERIEVMTPIEARELDPTRV